MNRISHILLSSWLLTLGHIPCASAQDGSNRPSGFTIEGYFGAGLGVLRPGIWRPSVLRTAGVGTPYGSLAFRHVLTMETLALFPSKTPVERTRTYGLLYGQTVGLPNLPVSFSVAAGPGFHSTVRRGHFLSEGWFDRQYERQRDRKVVLL
jgi:hypothetical protein